MSGNPWQDRSDKLWKFSEDLTSICILGALWLVCSLPVITIGAATTSMYTVFMRRILFGRKELVTPFFSAFRANFKRATAAWLILFAVLGLLALDAYYYLFLSPGSGFHTVMGTAILCLLSMAVMVACYVFPMLALYRNPVKSTLIKSAQSACISWPWTLLAFTVSVAIPALTVIGLWYLVFLFVGAVGYINSHIMVRAFRHEIPGGRGIKII